MFNLCCERQSFAQVNNAAMDQHPHGRLLLLHEQRDLRDAQPREHVQPDGFRARRRQRGERAPHLFQLQMTGEPSGCGSSPRRSSDTVSRRRRKWSADLWRAMPKSHVVNALLAWKRAIACRAAMNVSAVNSCASSTSPTRDKR